MAHTFGALTWAARKSRAWYSTPPGWTGPLCRIRLSTEADRGYGHICSRIAQLCKEMGEATGLPLPEKIGMGTPGTTDPPTGLLKNSNTQCHQPAPAGQGRQRRDRREFRPS